MLTNILLIVIIIELFFIWMHSWGINISSEDDARKYSHYGRR